MREITRSVKVALKCLIAVVIVDVDLQYWTSQVEHLVAFAATAHAQRGLFMYFRCKFRHRHSIHRPRFPIRVQNIGDLATFSVDFVFYMLNVCHISTSGLFDLLAKKYNTRVDPHVDNSHQV